MTWLLIDGNNWLNIDYFGGRKEEKLTPAKMLDNFMRRVHTVAEKAGADRVCIAFDGFTSWRKAEFSYYKGNRDEKPDDFFEAQGVIMTGVAQSAYEFHYSENFEADDLIADLSRDAMDEGERAVICSSDADLHQCLVAGQVSQITKVKRLMYENVQYTYMTAGKLKEQFQVDPWQWVEFRMLAGDKSDGLKAIEDFGPSGASKVLSVCKTLDGFLENPLVPRISGKMRQAVIDFCKSPKRAEFHRLMTLGRISVESAPR